MGDVGPVDLERGARYRFRMTLSRAASDRPEPDTARRSRWWRWAFVLALACVAFFLLHRWPTRIPLSDGTTLEFSEITTGTKHSHPGPLNWTGLKHRISSRSWQADFSTVESPLPSAVLWFHEPATFPPDITILTVDHNGWRWGPGRGRRAQVAYIGGGGVVLDDFENRGELKLEVYDRTFTKRLGAATIPVPVPEQPPPAPPTEPPPLPLQKTAGPWSFDIRAVQVQVRDEIPSRSHVEIQFDSRWHGEPCSPGFRGVTIRDSLGRKRLATIMSDGTFQTDLSPFETVWDLDLAFSLGARPPLNSEETLLFQPTVTADTPVAIRDRTIDGKPWRVVVAGPGRFTVPFRLLKETMTFNESIPVIVAELPGGWAEYGIKATAVDGTTRKVEMTNERGVPENVVVARCPTLDMTAGDTLQITVDMEQHIQFSVRPEIQRAAGPPAASASHDGLR